MNAFGTHILLEMGECDETLLDDGEYIREVMVGAARQAGATIIGESFHKFDPRGVTGIIAVAESHLAIHTWPEHGYAAVDIFTCGESFKPREAADLLIERLRCARPAITEVQRGPLSKTTAPAV